MYIVQSVLNCLKNINPVIRTYILCLMLSSSRKNCAAMARSTGISEKRLYCFLAKATINSQEIEENLFSLANETQTKDSLRALVIDPTAIIKHHAEKMEKICHDRAGCTKRVEKGLVPVYAAVADKKITIPLILEFWVQEKIVGKKRYQSKIKIAQNLILTCKKKGLLFDFTSLDGAFSIGEDMFTFFKKEYLKFIMRIAKSRRITTEDGISAQLKNHPALKLRRNEREKTVTAKLYGETYFFTAQKRQTRSGEWETIFLVSNMELSAKEQVAAYNLRWPIEKMIRTTKQKFGAAQCQAVHAAKQQAHIQAGFLAYAILNVASNDKQKQSVDESVNIIRESHFDDLIDSITECKKPKYQQNIDPDVKLFQNKVQNLSNNCDFSSFFTT